MGIMDEWGDALVRETLREAADVFFGARKEVEDEIALFQSRAAELRVRAEKIRLWTGGLFFLLGPEGSADLPEGLRAGLTAEDAPEGSRLVLSRLKSFTRKGLFVKTAWRLYAELAGMIDAYMHGAPYADPLYPGRKLVSVHYDQVRRHCEAVNERIVRLNESNRPSESLGFAKRMNQNQAHKESVTGGGEGTVSLDEDLAFSPIEFEACGLPFFPDLPVDGATEKQFRDLCAGVFAREPERAVMALETLLRG